MIGIQGYSSYLIPYLFPSGSSQNSGLKSTDSLTQLLLYNSSSLMQAYSQSQAAALQQGGQVTQQVSSVWNNFSSLSGLAKGLTTSGSTSAFNQRTVTSSNSAAVTGTAASGAAQATYSVGVSQLAVAQQNSGTALLSAGTNLSAGVTTSATYSFSLKTNSQSQQTYYVNVKSGDSNQQVLQKMADSINTANSAGTAAVKAQVVTTVTGGVQYSRLAITAASTGTDNGFTLSDNSGALAVSSGVTTATTAAQNANYTVNGASYTSQTNTPVISGSGLTLNFAKTTTQNVSLSVGLDVASVTQKMTDFVQQYNATVTSLQNSGLTMGSSLINRLVQSFSNESSDLASIGLTLNADHTLSLDQSAFQQAFTTNPNQVSSLLSGYGHLAAGVQSVAQSVTTLAPSWLASTQSPYPGTDSSQNLAAQFQQYVQNTSFNTFFGSSGSFLNIAA
jgi:flagellar hook-associated protein 2